MTSVREGIVHKDGRVHFLIGSERNKFSRPGNANQRLLALSINVQIWAKESTVLSNMSPSQSVLVETTF